MKKLTTVACVDDDPDIRTIVALALSDIGGLETQVFDAGTSLLKNIKKLDTDVILMDMMMPGLTGLETLAELQKMGLSKRFPVIIMTAKAQDHEVSDYLRKGALSVIVKPFDPMSLSQLVAEIYYSAPDNEADSPDDAAQNTPE